jgi:regulator of protease activity HflC (stomatin/prohibitin superfamily)
MRRGVSYMWDEIRTAIICAILTFLAFITVIATLWGMYSLSAVYQVWHQGKVGEAELRKAEFTRQIAVKEALAKKDAASMLALAEIERAKGIAQANKIIADSLKGNEAYLHYLWIDALHNTKNQVIYIPTEASLPILEAKR